PDALPGILALVAHGDTHVGRGGEVDRLEAHPIHHRADGESLGRVDADGRPGALIAITERGIDESDLSHAESPVRYAATPAHTRPPRHPARESRRPGPGPRRAQCSSASSLR